ncbi:MAG: cytochrome c [Chloroflexota bacterium]
MKLNPTLLLFLFSFLILITGCAEPQLPNISATLTISQAQGKSVFAGNCAACHATTPDTIIVGPSLAGVSSRAGENSTTEESRYYIETSILKPGSKITEGFQDLMPKTFGETLSGDEFDALVDYLMSIK